MRAIPVLWRRRLRHLHRGLGLILSLQLLFWIGGGLVMSILNIDAVRGSDQRNTPPPVPLDPAQAYLSPGELIRQQAPVTSLRLGRLLERPVYIARNAEGARLFDAASGEALSPLSAELARQIARADFSGAATISAVHWIGKDDAGSETRGRELPLWRVDFADARSTRLYISPRTGEVVARRNQLWRIFDFVWMLHIMDYRAREDFNHPLLTGFAATALAFVLSGLLMLLVHRKRPQSPRRMQGSNAP